MHLLEVVHIFFVICSGRTCLPCTTTDEIHSIEVIYIFLAGRGEGWCKDECTVYGEFSSQHGSLPAVGFYSDKGWDTTVIMADTHVYLRVVSVLMSSYVSHMQDEYCDAVRSTHGGMRFL